MDQRKNNEDPANNKARKMDVGGSCGKKNRLKMDYSCDRVDAPLSHTRDGETKETRTVECLPGQNIQGIGNPGKRILRPSSCSRMTIADI